MPFLWGIGTALWLGILTSLSPCPLATNVAAISFVSRRTGHPQIVLLSGFFYAFGRMAAYVVVGGVTISGLLAIPGVAFGLQKYMNALLGPLLVVTGIVILGIVPFPSFGSSLLSNLPQQAEKWGGAGSFLLGFLFALSFCPASAGLFFGSLLPLAMAQGSKIIFPAFYGAGTAIPVIVVAVLIAFFAKSIGAVFQKISLFEKWARWATGAVFIVIGIYYSAVFLFQAT